MAAAQEWPAASMAQVRDTLCAPGARFEMETVMIEGVPTRVWKNAHPDLTALARHARGHGQTLFTIHEDERVSYDAWFRATAALACHLLRLGVRPGDRVAIAMRNLPEWPVAFFAGASLGAILVPLNGWWTGPELAYGLENSGASVLICDAERWERIGAHREALPALRHVLVSRAGDRTLDPAARLEDVIGTPHAYRALPDQDLPAVSLKPDDPVTIFYTSGTTGRPKGALGTHRNMLTNILSTAYGQARAMVRRGEPYPPAQMVRDIGLLVIPLFHVTACNARMIGAMQAGHTLIFMRKWDTVQAFEIIERERVTSAGGVPTIAWQLLEHPERDKYDLSSLRSVAYGGAPAAPELARQIKQVFGAWPGNGWGMTETSATVSSISAEDYLLRPDSCGAPVPVADVKVMTPDGKTEVPVGEVGELWARGPQVLRHYWNNIPATADTFTQGWVRTGDLGRVDAEGFCYILDRAKDVIIRGGENIYSIEIEDVLYDHPAVMDAAVVPRAHRTLGEEPVAVVQVTPGADVTEADLQAWVRDRLAAFKIPVSIRIQEDGLPRNANGKILKKDLKALF
ncbi:MAG: class I adenylate-forming enzyme family protein [Alphaproteobacteria bacterium]